MRTSFPMFLLFCCLPAQQPDPLLGKWVFDSFDFSISMIPAGDQQEMLKKAAGNEIIFFPCYRYQTVKKGGTAAQNMSGVYSVKADTVIFGRDKVVIIQLDSLYLKLHSMPLMPDIIFKRVDKQ
jgi:hypothetical protein